MEEEKYANEHENDSETAAETEKKKTAAADSKSVGEQEESSQKKTVRVIKTDEETGEIIETETEITETRYAKAESAGA